MHNPWERTVVLNLSPLFSSSLYDGTNGPHFRLKVNKKWESFLPQYIFPLSGVTCGASSKWRQTSYWARSLLLCLQLQRKLHSDLASVWRWCWRVGQRLQSWSHFNIHTAFLWFRWFLITSFTGWSLLRACGKEHFSANARAAACQPLWRLFVMNDRENKGTLSRSWLKSSIWHQFWKKKKRKKNNSKKHLEMRSHRRFPANFLRKCFPSL